MIKSFGNCRRIMTFILYYFIYFIDNIQFTKKNEWHNLEDRFGFFLVSRLMEDRSLSLMMGRCAQEKFFLKLSQLDLVYGKYHLIIVDDGGRRHKGRHKIIVAMSVRLDNNYTVCVNSNYQSKPRIFYHKVRRQVPDVDVDVLYAAQAKIKESIVFI